MRSMPSRGFMALAILAAGCESKLSAPILRPPEQVSVNVGPEIVEIQFSAVEGATHYRIYYTSDPTLEAATAAFRETAVAEIIPLQSGATWRIAVSAWSGVEESDLSPVLSAAPLAAGPTFPEGPDVVIKGQAGDRIGVNVAALDYDGDGADDLFIASGDTSGTVRIHPGQRGGPDVQSRGEIGSSTTDGTFALGMAGVDIDGDGLEELIVGEAGFDEGGGGPDNGRLFVLRGRPLLPSGIPYQFVSPLPSSFGGSSLAALGDVNADGFGDFASAEPGGPHQVRVFLGDGEFGISDVALPVANGGDIRVASGGDVDGDGIPDLLVSSPDAPDGYCALHLGTASGLFDETPSWTSVLTAGSRYGEGLSFVGDMDGDGADEFAVGAPGTGQVLVHSWTDDAPVAFVYAAEAVGFGRRIVAAGNPDGSRALRNPFDDLFVADPSVAGDSGAVRFYASSGRTNQGYAEVWSATGAAGERFGEAVVAGDFDGDGAPDVAIGAPMADVGLDALAGEVRVFLARRYDGPVVSAGPTLSEQQGFRVYLDGAGFVDPVRGQSHVCTWIWGDATPNTILDPCDGEALQAVTHPYESPGEYHPVLRVESPLGAGEAATTVHVRDLDE